MPHIDVDQELCLGYALCVGRFPDLFEMAPDTDQAIPTKSKLSPDDLVRARAAISGCPIEAISLRDDDADEA